MIWKLILRVVTTSLGRWILGGSVALLLATSAYKWHQFKEDLIHQGQQVCVQEINKQTMIDLQAALVAERIVAEELRANAVANAAVNEEARARLRDSESRVDSLLAAQKAQEKTDETYAAWSNTTLPSGVADRLRNAAAGSDTSLNSDDDN